MLEQKSTLMYRYVHKINVNLNALNLPYYYTPVHTGTAMLTYTCTDEPNEFEGNSLIPP